MVPTGGWSGNLAALMQTCRLVFKDDTRAVIDLAERLD
jgi:hypothetical protein